MNLILASQSPRRRELLSQLGLEFTIKVADIDETMDANLAPEVEVARISQEKAGKIALDYDENTVILAADTIVVLGEKVLGKPKDKDQAKAMLTALSGATHQVFTAVTLVKGDLVDTFVTKTAVTFRQLAELEISSYIATGEPMDKAGSYGIQGLGATFVCHLDGDYFNVMGLPLCDLVCHLRGAGIPILDTI